MKISLTRFLNTKEFLQSTKKLDLSSPVGTDKMVSLGILVGFFLLFFQSLFLLLVYRSLPKQLPLFYSRPFGEEQLGERVMLWVLPLLSLVVFTSNIFLVKKIGYPALNRIIILIALAVIILLIITQFKIITT